jgi:hypothetical protein
MLPALKAHVCTPMLRKVTLACKPTHLHRRPFNTSVAASAGVAVRACVFASVLLFVLQ